MVAAREVATPYSAFKNHIAGNQQSASRIKEDYVPRRMARTVQHLQGNIPHANRIAFVQPAIGLQRLTVFKTKHPALRRQSFQPELIFFFRTNNRHAIMLRQLRRRANMIEMTVREQNLHQANACRRDFLFDSLSVTAGIDQRRQFGLFTPD